MRPWPALILAAAGCFADSNPAAEGGSTGTACAVGSNGCPCYGNLTCDDELTCDGGYCVDPQCVAGTENCPCLPSGGCDVGLVCEGVCKPPGGTGSADASATSIDPTMTTAEVGPGESGVMSTTTDSNGDMSMSEVGTMSDTTVACAGCAPGEICDGGGLCVSLEPYVPCGMTGCDCATGANGENVCAPTCDPMLFDCASPPLPAPVAVCIDPMNGADAFCLMECGFDPGSCPPEMPCAMVTQASDAVWACMWPASD